MNHQFPITSSARTRCCTALRCCNIVAGVLVMFMAGQQVTGAHVKCSEQAVRHEATPEAASAGVPNEGGAMVAEPPSREPEPGVGKVVIYEEGREPPVKVVEDLGPLPDNDGSHKWLPWLELATCRGATLGVRFRDDYGGYQFRVANTGVDPIQGFFKYRVSLVHPEASGRQERTLLVGMFSSDASYRNRGLEPGQIREEKKIVVDRFVNAIPGDPTRQRVAVVMVEEAYIGVWSEFAAQNAAEKSKWETSNVTAAGKYEHMTDLPKCGFDVRLDVSSLVQAWTWPSPAPEKPNTFNQIIVFDGPRLRATSHTRLGDATLDIPSVDVGLDIDRSKIDRVEKVALPREQFGRPSWALVVNTSDPSAFTVSAGEGTQPSTENEGMLYFGDERDADSTLSMIDRFRRGVAFVKEVAKAVVSAAKTIVVDDFTGKTSASDANKAFAEALRKKLENRMMDVAIDELPELVAQSRFSKSLRECSDEEFIAIMEQSSPGMPAVTVLERLKNPKAHVEMFLKRYLQPGLDRVDQAEDVP